MIFAPAYIASLTSMIMHAVQGADTRTKGGKAAKVDYVCIFLVATAFLHEVGEAYNWPKLCLRFGRHRYFAW